MHYKRLGGSAQTLSTYSIFGSHSITNDGSVNNRNRNDDHHVAYDHQLHHKLF